MPVEAVPAGRRPGVHAQRPALDRFDTGATWPAVLTLLLIAGAIASGARPRRWAQGRQLGRSATSERGRLVDRREALFAELVALEQEARAAGGGAPPPSGASSWSRELEQVYRDLAALDEQRAA